MLAFGAAFGISQNSEGKIGVLKFLEEQPFGKVFLGVMGMGLLCYAFWRFFQSISNPENIGDDNRGLSKRIGFFFSGLIYTGLGAYAIFKIFSQGSSGQSKSGMLNPTYLPYAFYAVAAGLAIKSIFQFIKAYKGDFLSKFHLSEMSDTQTGKTVKWLGYLGLVSRGIVVGIVSYFFFNAADTAGTGDIKGTADAFTFLNQNSQGPWMVALVAIGLICYGTYMLAMAKYRRFKD